MIRKFPLALVGMLFAVLMCGNLWATTYYIAANGSDSNNGTSKTTPWLHAPGMPNCSVTCASTTPQPGDQFIFRGGDTWHYGNSAASPYVGSGTNPHWNWSWSGSAANCSLNAASGTVTKSSCIYVGVDPTWYSTLACGSSWCRPIMNADNPHSTGYVSSCTYDQTTDNFLFERGNYVIVDNFEWTGWCWATSSTPGAVVTVLGSASNAEVSNMYFHGWTLGSGAVDQFRMITCNGTGCSNSSYIEVDHNVFDGSDSSLGTTTQKASGFALGVGYEISYNVFWHVSNGYIGGSAVRIHDNLLFYLMEPSDATHGNLFEQQGYNSCSTYFYNNLEFETNEGEGNNLYSAPSCPVYIFNNVSFLYRVQFSGGNPINGTDGTNCFLPENTGGSGSRTWTIFNNTFDFPCAFSQKNIVLTQTFQNNHLIGYSPSSLASLANPTIIDNGDELFQTEAVANGQGYTQADYYSPTAGGATIGTGANLASTCTAISDLVVAAACQFSYGGVTYNQASHQAIENTPVPRPSSGPWDVGAYQYASSVGGPNPPSGLAAVVQ